MNIKFCLINVLADLLLTHPNEICILALAQMATTAIWKTFLWKDTGRAITNGCASFYVANSGSDHAKSSESELFGSP